MSEYYWDLTTDEGDVIPVPPKAVAQIQAKLAKKEVLNLPTRSLQHWQVKNFKMSDRPFGQQQLEAEISQAFKEPIINEDEDIQARWVKKKVTGDSWNKHYSKIPAYKKLGDDGVMTTVAFTLPTHEINLAVVRYCTLDDIKVLTRK